MAESFDGGWLDLREPFDAAARDPGLATRLAAVLPARPRILDLGAGTGSLLRWLGHFIGRAQAWTLVDADEELIERAFETIAERAVLAGWGVTFPGKKTLLVHSPRGAWRVEGLVVDLEEAPDNLPLHAVDALVNSALCDLVSRDWLDRVAAACAARRLPFYATLNVSGRGRFAPPHRDDALVARGFARDQARDKGFGGIALGAKAPEAITEVFEERGYEVLRAPSDWLIPRTASRMALELAQGHADAARQRERRDEERIGRWALDRAVQARDLRLSVRVGHADLLALPGGKDE
jgi:SAM-dependent methyltransferase